MWDDRFQPSLDGDIIDTTECRSVVVCKYCRKKYLQVTIDQEAGFRDRDNDICPYCNQSNGSSMSVEYSNYKIDDEE